MPHYVLKLYVTGQASTSLRAIANLERLCEENLAGQYDLQVIDVLKQPALAEADRIIAAPVLIKQLPEPATTIVGDLSDRQQVLIGLNLLSKEHV